MPGVESDEAPESCVWQKNHIFTSKGCVLLSALLYNVFKGHLTTSFPTLKKKKLARGIQMTRYWLENLWGCVEIAI